MTRWARIGISVTLVAALLWVTEPGAAWARLRGAQIEWLALAGLLLTTQTVLMALRWTWVAERLGLRIGLRWAIGEYYLGQAVNTTLPGGVVGDAARAVRSRGQAGMWPATQAVMIERLAGQIALLAVGGLGFAAAIWWSNSIAWPSWAGWVGFGAIAVFAGLASLATRVAPGFTAAVRVTLFGRDVWLRQAVLGLLIVSLNLAAFAACARATGTTLPLGAIATVIPLILTAMLIPLSVAGWGWREGAAAALFPFVGADPAAGIAAGVAFGLVMLAASLPGLVWPILAPPPGARLDAGTQRSESCPMR